MTGPPICPIHEKPATVIFMCCRGAVGGKSTSPKKVRAVRKSLKKAREAKRQDD